MERQIYRYGETNLCYRVIFIFKFLSIPFTKVKYIQQVVKHRYYDVDHLI